LRVGVAGGLAETVIERNTPVPIEQMRTFTTFQDQQESVKIRVYQGESRQAEENELLGQFEFRGFKKAPRGEVAIDISFEINADGIVNVTAQDRDTGEQASTQITLSSGLSEGEIQEIIEEARSDRLEPVPTDDDGNALVPLPEEVPQEGMLPREGPQDQAAPEPVAIGVIGQVPQEPAAEPPSPRDEGGQATADRATVPLDLEKVPLEASDTPHDEAETAEREAFALEVSEAAAPERGEQQPVAADSAAAKPDLSLTDTDPCLFDAEAGEEGLFEDPGQDLSSLPSADDGEEED
jgi:hypothetical protein